MMISIEVVYALPERQRLIALQVEEGCTVLAAAQRSGIAQAFDESDGNNRDIDWGKAALGIFGKIVEQPAQTLLRDGDRIEIYRPLIADPKTARRQRAQKKR
ncbi:MAG: RnfH family protein [Spongiibacteraceae bacterium]